jgi:hypothetical protein
MCMTYLGYAEVILFMPGRMTWCSPGRGHSHHALTFPSIPYIFDTQSRKWEKKVVMEYLFGKESSKIVFPGDNGTSLCFT